MFVWQTLYCKELLAKQDLYSRYHRSLVLLDKIINQDNIVQVVPEVTLCAWTHTTFIILHDFVLGHKYMELLLASYYVIPGIPSHSSLVSSYGTMILHWCCQVEHLLHLRSSSTPTTTIYIIYNFNIHIHLRLHRLQFCCRPKCSAVGIVALRCEQCSPFVNDSATFNASWCYHLLMLVKHYPSSTYVPDPRPSFCCMVVPAHCTV